MMVANQQVEPWRDTPATGSTVPEGIPDIASQPFVAVDSWRGLVDSLYWVVRTDSSSPVLRSKRARTPQDTVAVMPTTEQVRLVIQTLGFSKRQLGEIFGVTRQAIYEWLKGGNISEGNARKLQTLARLISEITEETRRPLFHGFTVEPILPGEPALFDALRETPWDEGRLRRLLRKARELSSERAAREFPALDGSTRTREEANLLHNFISLGVG